jgi:hypothetical protein
MWSTASERSEGSKESANQLAEPVTPYGNEKKTSVHELHLSQDMKSAAQAVILSRLRTACGDEPSPYMM